MVLPIFQGKVSLQEANNLFNQVISSKDKNNNNICSISHLPLDKDFITLPCNHQFNYMALIKDLQVRFSREKRLTCPYCRKIISSYLPIRLDLYPRTITNIHGPNGISYEKHTCLIPECSYNATIPFDSKYCCHKHYKSVLKTHTLEMTPRCSAIFKSGKRKGETCNAIIKNENSIFCCRHIKNTP